MQSEAEAKAKSTNKVAKYGFGLIGALVVLGVVGSFLPDKPPNTGTTGAEPAGQAVQPVTAEASKLPVPEFQQGFMAIVDANRTKYQATDNQLTKSALVTERLAQFEKLKGSPRKISDWVGQLKTIGTTGDGKAFISVALSDKLIFMTFNVEFIDTQERSLIPQSSPLYKKLETLKVGDKVKFSGQLKRPINLTEAGKMEEPTFLFIFTDISKI